MIVLSIIVRMMGGIWQVRQKYQAANSRFLKSLYNGIFNLYLQSKGSYISIDGKFRGEPCFPHGLYGVFISAGATIGKNCVIYHHVTIGSNTLIDSGGIGAPTIGDGCSIAAGAKVIGDIIVGNNVRIGSNCFVYQDVSDNSVITCGTPRIVKMKKTLNNRFYRMYNGKWIYFDNGAWFRVQTPKEIMLLGRKFTEKGITEKPPDKSE
jgi:serine O-acetyltransferase